MDRLYTRGGRVTLIEVNPSGIKETNAKGRVFSFSSPIPADLSEVLRRRHIALLSDGWDEKEDE